MNANSTALEKKPQHSAVTAKPERQYRLSEVGEPRQRELMVAMWHRMGAIFGSAWESQYGTVEDQTIRAWESAMSDFTVEQMSRGIKACHDWQKDFPPNLPQFKNLCLTVNNKNQDHLQKYLLPKKRDEKKGAQAQSAFSIAAQQMGYLDSGRVDTEATPPICEEAS